MFLGTVSRFMNRMDVQPLPAPTHAPPARAATTTFVALCIAHATGDLLGGNWPIFKMLAGLDLFWAGVIATVATTSMTAVQPILGFYADRGHRRLLVVLGAALTVATVFQGPIMMNRGRLGDPAVYMLLFGILLLIRFGQSMFHPPGTSIAGNTSSKRRSTLVALFITCGMLGYASNWLVFSWVWETFDRQTLWLLVPALPVLGFIWWGCRPTETRHEHHERLRDVLGQLGHVRRPLVLLYLIQALMSALTIGLQFLLPEFSELNGYPALITKGGSLFLLIGGGMLFMIPAGHVADRFGRRRTLLGLLLLTLAAYTPLVFISGLPVWGFCVLCVLTGGVNMASGPIVIAIAQHMAPKRESMISGVMMGLAWALGSLSTTVVGYLAEFESIGIFGALQWMTLTAVAAVPLGLMLPKVADAHD